ncbi:ribonuclease H-like domain-containing protein [Tanacetum coccineum]
MIWPLHLQFASWMSYTPTKSWLWHQRLSHLNFNTINDLARNDLVTGLPKFKYHKEHLCPSCEQGKSKRASHSPKPVPNSKQRLKQLLLRATLKNRSIIHRRFNKTPYELINGRKPDISFLHVFGALCYPKNDHEDIRKLGAKAMAFEQSSLKPGLQSMTSGQISSGLDLPYASSTIKTQNQLKLSRGGGRGGDSSGGDEGGGGMMMVEQSERGGVGWCGSGSSGVEVMMWWGGVRLVVGVGEGVSEVQNNDENNVFANERQHSENNTAECANERVAFANLIANLTLDTEENQTILKQLKKANTSLTQELEECKTNLDETSMALGEATSCRVSCLIALQNKQNELEKYTTFNDGTIDYEILQTKLNDTLGLLALKDIEIKEGLKTKAYEISVLNQKHDELVKKSLLTKSQYEGQLKEKSKVISDLKVKEEKDIDKMIEMDKQLKFLNEIVYTRNQSIQTIHMLAPKCSTYNGRPTFANPRSLQNHEFGPTREVDLTPCKRELIIIE